jgi:hypothetical protein
VFITRWTSQDIVSGVSDPDIYPLLEKMEIPLYVHPTIHLKLYVFSDGSAVQGSCNLTHKGFGWDGVCNNELAAHTTLGMSDWRQIDKILRQSERIDRTAYDIVTQYKQTHVQPMNDLPPLVFPMAMASDFSLLSLPASGDPIRWLSDLGTTTVTPETTHDLILFGFDEEAAALTETSLKIRYRRLPIVAEVIRWLAAREKASFGEVSQWLHSICTDRPLPYRSTIKEAVQNLYRWLPFAFEEISVERPRHSDLLVWNDRPACR